VRVVVLALALVLVTLGAQPARAATVDSMEMAGGGRSGDPFTLVRYTAAPGEANRLVVRATADGARVQDAVPIEAGAGCEAISDREVECRSEPGSFRKRFVSADLGDGDDATDLQGAVSVDGGSGEDRLTGGDGPQTLTGGMGRDVIDGGPGSDVVAAGPGEPGEPPDQLAGGDGRDQLTFAGSPGPAEVDLGAGRARVGAKEFGLTSFEVLHGSGYPDRLSGGPGPDQIRGFGGGDVVDGREGNDELVGGDDRDVVLGGPGGDRLEDDPDVDADADVDSVVGPAGEGGNRYECGPGTDEVVLIGSVDRIGASCETIGDHRLLADLRRPARAHLRLSLDPCHEGDRCGTRLTLRSARRTLLLRRTFRTNRNVDRAAVVRLDPAIRRILRRERATRVRVDLRPGDPGERTRFIVDLTG